MYCLNVLKVQMHLFPNFRYFTDKQYSLERIGIKALAPEHQRRTLLCLKYNKMGSMRYRRWQNIADRTLFQQCQFFCEKLQKKLAIQWSANL